MPSKKKALVVPSSGLGDGLLFASVCHNLTKAGFHVDCLHDKLAPLNEWTPLYQILSLSQWTTPLEEYDQILINQEDTSQFCKKLLSLVKEKNLPFHLFSPSSRRDSDPKTHVLCQRDIPLLDSLGHFFASEFPPYLFEKKTGIESPDVLKKASRVIIQPAASSSQRQWPLRRYAAVSKSLENMGMEPVFVFWNRPEEIAIAEALDASCRYKIFSDLQKLAVFLKSSSYFIGNDSGMGHLASSLGIPTLTIFNCYRKKILWKPAYALNMGIAPSRFILNIKGFRLRNYSFFFISKWQVMRKFKQLQRAVQNVL